MIHGLPFREAANRAGSVSVADLLRMHGRASWPGLLLVLSVLSMIPLAGVGTALSLPLFAVAMRWPGRTNQGAPDEVPIPTRLLAMQLGPSWSRRSLRLFATVYDTARSTMQRRWLALRHPRTSTGWRIWIAMMALLILLPMPLGNLLPGLSLALLGLGWIYKDGKVLGLSLIAGTLALGYVALSVHILGAMVENAVSWWS